MLPVVWSSEALDQLDDIVSYIAARNSSAADRMQALFEGSAERVPLHPYLYRKGRVAGTREVVMHPNYILVYRIETDAIVIVALVHARQNYP